MRRSTEMWPGMNLQISSFDWILFSLFCNFYRFFNHSCEPNCSPVFVHYEGQHPFRSMHVAFFALKNIRKGEELTWVKIILLNFNSLHSLMFQYWLREDFLESKNCEWNPLSVRTCYMQVLSTERKCVKFFM